MAQRFVDFATKSANHYAMLDSAKAQHQRTLDGIERLQQRLPFRLAVLSRLLDRHATRTLTPFDINLSTYRILLTIDAFGDLSPAELTRYAVVDKAQISRQCTFLRNAGLVEDVPDPQRPRRQRLALTEKGRARLDALLPAMDRREDAFAAQLDPDEYEALIRAVEKLTRHIATDLADA